MPPASAECSVLRAPARNRASNPFRLAFFCRSKIATSRARNFNELLALHVSPAAFVHQPSGEGGNRIGQRSVDRFFRNLPFIGRGTGNATTLGRP